MTKPNITPGDWGQRPIFHNLIDSTGETIAFIPYSNKLAAENGRALAALPELLKALEKALAILEDIPYPGNYAAADIRAALEKAGYEF
jgi:hypothetical protein